ncbi:molybdopterin-dependent oxidoreductase [Trinickia caryophylli]|uniref:nitrate reductase (cytochrome) n=1 Tax=Trinickia caryophylli TaxID=28094 RepID=A0A1X7HAF2_TRICW|nr:nitrate reductase [Trinickia caryophylli]PMS08987.1 nitrate reductase [Trinickia caryophylli]TRX15024.1 molybdopterin-dependent oxidoreductase [Trinickia caryophylli]WQE14881.1 molybdopterin-dependent oxidoreductase [Trinickia caryophylli]SMF82184.1 assimilatory nitrate reductase (NADH) alpha subunit apoprotein [Trinickia caryophylli]GLU35776.1 nitrate reductase subunit alpha [Trinickia caryophylli]
MKTVTRSTCCYCGVGCGVLIEAEDGRITGIAGDPDHPANFGRLCTKGRTLPLTAATTAGRALQPELRTQRDAAREPVDWSSALDHVAERFADIIERHGPDAVAFYISGQLLTEDYYVFNKLAKGLVRTNNIDTNSRLCMSSAVTAYKKAFGADGPPTCYEDLELAQTVLFAGSNMPYAHPVLFRRLEDAKAKNPSIRWIVVDPRRTDVAALADLHLAIQPGTDVALFNGMLHHLIWEGMLDRHFIDAHTHGFAELKALVREYSPRVAAGICGIAEQDLIRAAEWFAASPATLSLYCMGLNQSSHGTDKNLSLINLHLATRQIGRPGAGPFSLTGQPNAMGGREVGGMATMLAAHRDIGNAAHRAEVEALWGVQGLSDRPGMPAVEMFDAIADGRIKAVWIACTNPVHSMPDIARVRKALKTAEFVVVQEAFTQTDTVPYADVLLPASTWGEKSGTVTNSERRISRVRPAIDAPGEARPDWWIVAEVARRLERRLAQDEASRGDTAPGLFPYGSPAEIFDEHRTLTVGRDLDIGGLSYAVLEEQGPRQWPYVAHAPSGLARRYTDGRFATADGRAQFQLTPYLPVAESADARYPFRLVTGRLRDQWHGMSRTGRADALFAHAPEATVVMHRGDATRRGLKEGDLVSVASRRGKVVLPLEVSDDVRSGTLFAAMHWSGQYLNSGGVNEATIGAVDPYSGQPELKHAAVRIEVPDLPWRVVAAKRGDTQQLRAAVQPLLAERRYASVRIEDEGLLVVSAADGIAHPEWVEKLHDALGLPRGDDLLEYRDPRRGREQRVAWSDGNVIDGFLLTGETSGARAMIEQIRSGTAWPGPRHTIFLPGGEDALRALAPRARIVCNCKQVTQTQIEEAVAAQASLDDLKSTLGCGTVCGSCVPEIKRLMNATAVA